MSKIIAVTGIAFNVADLDKSVDFYTRTWGLGLMERDEKVARFRGRQSIAPVLTLAQTGEPAIDYVTMLAKDPDAVVRIGGNLAALGYEVVDQPGTEYPEGRHGLTALDPDGNRVRIIGQPATLLPSQNPDMPDGISHLALNCRDQDASRKFYVEGLGFQVRDRSRNTGLDFLGCDNLHHRIAIMGGFDKPRINHVSFELPDLDTFLRKTGMAVQAGALLVGGPGRHDTGDNTFAYFADPDDRVIEFSSNMEVIPDPDNWTPRFWISGLDQWGFGIPLRNEEMRKRTL